MKPTRKKRGFTLVECMLALAICSVLFLATLSALGYARTHNELEQERIRAHQIVSEYLEVERFRLFSWTQSESQQTIWDNGTPDDTSDDTLGTLEVAVRDPDTGAVLTMAPDPARLVEIEVTLTWQPRVARLKGKTFRESVMTYKAP
jgi:prepilin-type N-terminal cleavage/methylation domain-containing protein